VRGKHIIWLCLAAVLFMSPLVVNKSFAQNENVTVVVNPPTIQSNPTQDFTVEVDVSGITGCAGFDLKMTWDTALTEFPPVVSSGDFLSNYGTYTTSGIFQYNNFLFKYVEVGEFITTRYGSVDGDGSLAFFTFHVKSTQSGTSILHLFDVRLFDYLGNLIPVSSTSDGFFFTTVPFVDFTVTPPNPIVGQVVTFDGSPSFDPVTNSHVLSDYKWDFGDGSPIVDSGANPVVTHVYGAYNLNPYQVTLTATKGDGESWFVTKPLLIWRDLMIATVWPTMTETDTTDYSAYQTTLDYYENPGYGLLSVVVVVQNLGTVTEYYSLDVVVSGKDYYGMTHTWDITSTEQWFYGYTYPRSIVAGGGSGFTNWFLFDISYDATTSIGLLGEQINSPVPPGQYTITATVSCAADQDPINNVASAPFGVHGSVEATKIVRGAMTGKTYKASHGPITFGGFFENFDNTTDILRIPTDQGEYGRIAFDIYDESGAQVTEVTTPTMYLNYLQRTPTQYTAVWSDVAVGKYTVVAYAQFGTDGSSYPYFGYRTYTFSITVVP